MLRLVFQQSLITILGLERRIFDSAVPYAGPYSLARPYNRTGRKLRVLQRKDLEATLTIVIMRATGTYDRHEPNTGILRSNPTPARAVSDPD